MEIKSIEQLENEDLMNEELQPLLESEFSECYGCPKCHYNCLKMS